MNEDFKVQIGERLQLLRKKRKAKITELIDKLDIGRSTYTDWEYGRRSPNGEKLKQLAQFYSTTVDYIIGKTNDDAPRSDDLKEIIQKAPLVYEGKEISEEAQAAIGALIEAYFKKLDNN